MSINFNDDPKHISSLQQISKVIRAAPNPAELQIVSNHSNDEFTPHNGDTTLQKLLDGMSEISTYRGHHNDVFEMGGTSDQLSQNSPLSTKPKAMPRVESKSSIKSSSGNCTKVTERKSYMPSQ